MTKQSQAIKDRMYLMTDEVIEKLTNYSKKLANKFAFGYFDKEDIVQQCLLLAMEALPKYDGNRNLLNFLYTHIGHRLKNLLRNKKERINPPCEICADGCYCDPNLGEPCERHKLWLKRNSDKRSLVQPNYLPDGLIGENPEPHETMMDAELYAKLDNQLTGESRRLWLMLKDGARLNKADMSALKVALSEILGVQTNG